ncbi:hypothetical protein [Paracoccus mutanolyticus]|uniref:hypothetical protein n=1 Tax=Paracoccus mutanolyticus TaxID=1499308 RepID=UPI001CB8B518|nr:hypothetical protein [Paracoccus mutanolyticus]
MAVRNPRPHLWRAPGEAGRLGWLDWLHFGETLCQHVANLTQQHVFLREPSQRSPLLIRLETARLSRALGLVERTVAESEWLLSEFSGVDCQVGYSVWSAGPSASCQPAHHRRLSRHVPTALLSLSAQPAGTRGARDL